MFLESLRKGGAEFVEKTPRRDEEPRGNGETGADTGNRRPRARSAGLLTGGGLGAISMTMNRFTKGARVTDAVGFFARRGELRGAVREVSRRVPERFRWRKAVCGVNKVAGRLRGLDRMRVEEPIRELVLDLGDADLRREVVLDARRAGVDLDRGEVLPRMTLADLRRLAFLTRVDVRRIARHMKLPEDFRAPIDTAGSVVVGRYLSEHHRQRAHKLWLSVPDPDGPGPLRLHHRYMLERAERDRDEAERWAALAQALLAGG